MQAVSRAKRPCGMEQAGSLHREALRQPSGRWELRRQGRGTFSGGGPLSSSDLTSQKLRASRMYPQGAEVWSGFLAASSAPQAPAQFQHRPILAGSGQLPPRQAHTSAEAGPPLTRYDRHRLCSGVGPS